MIVMDDTSCMVNVARFFIEFCMTESCGKCIPCRAGTAQMFTLLSRICDGTGTMDDLTCLWISAALSRRPACVVWDRQRPIR
jgi:bidirectional [NiFe] hydrogenase diaphorase subunit